MRNSVPKLILKILITYAVLDCIKERVVFAKNHFIENELEEGSAVGWITGDWWGGTRMVEKIARSWAKIRRICGFVVQLVVSSFILFYFWEVDKSENIECSSLSQFYHICKMWIFKSSFQKYDAIHSFVIKWNSWRIKDALSLNLNKMDWTYRQSGTEIGKNWCIG